MAEEDLIFGKNRHLFGGAAPSIMKKFNIKQDPQGNIFISAELPDDTKINNSILSGPKGAIIRRKQNEYPKNEFDGDLVLNMKAKTLLFQDNSAKKDQTYYYAAFPYSDQGVFCRNERNQASVNEGIPLTSFKGIFNTDEQTNNISFKLKVDFPATVIKVNIYKTLLTKPEIKEENLITSFTSPGEFEDTNILLGNTYHYLAVSFSQKGEIIQMNRTSPCNYLEIKASQFTLYGFKIDKNNPDPEARVTYTDDAVGMVPAKTNLKTENFEPGSWTEDVFFRKNNHVWMVKSDGTPDYQLDDNDYTKKAIDGSPSDVSNSDYDGNVMTRFDIVWLNQWEDENYQYCQISNQKINENFHAYAHTKEDGNIMDYIWISTFENRFDPKNKMILRSYSGKPSSKEYPDNTGSTNFEELLQKVKNNGPLWNIISWNQFNMINMLLILIGKSTNTQETFGYGRTGYAPSGSATKTRLGNIGSFNSKGAFFGNDGNIGMKIFHLENYWGSQHTLIQGLSVDEYNNFTVKKESFFDTLSDNFIDTKVASAIANNRYIKATKMTQYGLFPCFPGDGASNQYFCDWYKRTENKNKIFYFGGTYDNRQSAGAFYMLATTTFLTGFNNGTRITCEQKK